MDEKKIQLLYETTLRYYELDIEEAKFKMSRIESGIEIIKNKKRKNKKDLSDIDWAEGAIRYLTEYIEKQKAEYNRIKALTPEEYAIDEIAAYRRGFESLARDAEDRARKKEDDIYEWQHNTENYNRYMFKDDPAEIKALRESADWARSSARSNRFMSTESDERMLDIAIEEVKTKELKVIFESRIYSLAKAINMDRYYNPDRKVEQLHISGAGFTGYDEVILNAVTEVPEEVYQKEIIDAIKNAYESLTKKHFKSKKIIEALEYLVGAGMAALGTAAVSGVAANEYLLSVLGAAGLVGCIAAFVKLRIEHKSIESDFDLSRIVEKLLYNRLKELGYIKPFYMRGKDDTNNENSNGSQMQ